MITFITWLACISNVISGVENWNLVLFMDGIGLLMMVALTGEALVDIIGFAFKKMYMKSALRIRRKAR